MTYVTNDNEIVLPVGHTAEPNQCGSCHFFRRNTFFSYAPTDIDGEKTSHVLGLHTNEYDRWGACTFKLPPKLDKFYMERPIGDGEGRSRSDVLDHETCDLYQHTGKTYIVSKRVKP